MIPYFKKTLCSVAQEIRCTLFFLFYLKNYLTSMFTEACLILLLLLLLLLLNIIAVPIS